MTTLPIALAALTLAAWVAIALVSVYSAIKIPRLDEPKRPRGRSCCSPTATCSSHPTPRRTAYGVRHLLRERLDHLSASPRLAVTGTILQSCMVAFHLFLGAQQRLWKVRDPRSRAFFGVGSCTFMRADSYHAIGGHERVALRPDEDLRIGQLVKMSGMRSAFLEGEEMVECPWYHSLKDLVRGCEKNFFAALDYSLWKMVPASATLLWLAIDPTAGGALFRFRWPL